MRLRLLRRAKTREARPPQRVPDPADRAGVVCPDCRGLGYFSADVQCVHCGGRGRIGREPS